VCFGAGASWRWIPARGSRLSRYLLRAWSLCLLKWRVLIGRGLSAAGQGVGLLRGSGLGGPTGGERSLGLLGSWALSFCVR
jgi:hypothetical protein